MEKIQFRNIRNSYAKHELLFRVIFVYSRFLIFFRSVVSKKTEEIFSSKDFKDLDLHPFMVSSNQ